MKRVLSFLLMVVFMHAQVSTAFAKRGGPDFGDQGSVDTIGSYAGTLTPVTSTSESTTSNANSIGLFGLGVPQVGVAQGTCLLFVEGAAFEGTITAVADPIGGELQGVIDATRYFFLVDPQNPTIPYRVFATGSINAEIKNTASGQAAGFQNAATFATTRVEGEAVVDISLSVDADGTPIVTNSVLFIVDGFKQSSQVVVIDVTGGGTGGNGGATP